MSLAPRRNAALRAATSYSMRVAVGVAALLAAVAPLASAQTPAPEPRRWEFRLASGSLVPTGAERAVIKRADLSAAQLSWRPRPLVAVSASLGWARSRDLGSVDSPKLDVFTSDVGVELHRAPWSVRRTVTFSPFAGFGAGMRSYDYRSGGGDATHNLSGYGTLGGEMVVRRVGFRVEARQYVSGFKPLGETLASATHRDVVFLAALRLVRRPSAQR